MKPWIYLINFVFLSLFSLRECISFPNIYPRIKLEAKEHGNAGQPLFLTTYLKQGQVFLAQNLSIVPLTERIGFRSHAGFFTVDEETQSNMYFWYFPPFSGNEKAPVVLWLQGGPGGSSLFGLFTELGPLIAKKEGFAKRKYHWALNNHLIFIDNPVGTGFSFTQKDEGYCENQDCVSRNLYECLQQFFTLFPHLQTNEFFITGESYAGKYIPALAMQIHQQNLQLCGTHNDEIANDKFVKEDRKKIKINLQGLAMGNAYCDPVNQIDYGDYLYQHGLIDDNQARMFEDLQNEIKATIRQKNWIYADFLMDKLMDGEVANFSYFKNFTGFNFYYNFLFSEEEDDMSVFADLLQNDNVRKACHVGNLPFNSGEQVQLHLALDILKSVAPYVEELLSHYRVLCYNGQLDIIVAYPLTESFLRNLDFKGAIEYHTAKRKIWKVGDEVAGYIKKAGNLTEMLVRNAGHMVPHDQPKWSFDMITKFIRNTL